MRIALVVSTFPPYKGGMGNVAAKEAELLALGGHAVTVFTLGDKETPEPDLGYQVVRLKPQFRAGNAGLVPELYSKLKDFQAVH
ncbi:MAG: glycosyltransferase family 1 protein, partial [bacterium]